MSDEREPISIPAVLSDRQVEIVRSKLRIFAGDKTRRQTARSLQYARMYVDAAIEGTVRPSVHFAMRLAKAIGVSTEALLELEEA